MQWQSNGELDQGDLIELVCHLRNVECDQHSDELSRLGQKHTEDSKPTSHAKAGRLIQGCLCRIRKAAMAAP